MTPSEQLMVLRRAFGDSLTFRHGYRWNSHPPVAKRVHYFTLNVRLERQPWTSFSTEGTDAVAVVDAAFRWLLGQRPK